MKRFITGTLTAVILAGAARADDAAALFQRKCAVCHGKDGKGNTKVAQTMGIKDLTKTSLSVAEYEKIIAEGKGKMPANKGKLSDEEIKSLAAYVKSGLK